MEDHHMNLHKGPFTKKIAEYHIPHVTFRHHPWLSPGARSGEVKIVRPNTEGRLDDLVQGLGRWLYWFTGRVMQRIHFPLHCEAKATKDYRGLECYRPRQERNSKGVRRSFHSGGGRSEGAQDGLKCFIFESNLRDDCKFNEELGSSGTQGGSATGVGWHLFRWASSIWVVIFVRIFSWFFSTHSSLLFCYWRKFTRFVRFWWRRNRKRQWRLKNILRMQKRWTRECCVHHCWRTRIDWDINDCAVIISFLIYWFETKIARS